MTRAALSLGANLGDPRKALAGAVAGLRGEPAIEGVTVSGLWRTAALGGPEQPDYLNAVVVIETSLTADQLLALAHRLEAAAGRRREVRWGPRTLDVDLLDVEGVARTDPELTLPHPRAHERGFVLAPWEQVDPRWPLAPAGRPPRPVRLWRADVADQDVTLVDPGAWWR